VAGAAVPARRRTTIVTIGRVVSRATAS